MNKTAALLSLLLITPLAPVAAQSYPARAVRIVVPFPAGGPTDIVTRLMAAKMTETLGQQVVVDNRGGAGGAIGTEQVAKSAPDGYTLVMGTIGGLAVAKSLNPKLGYDTLRDFAPITQSVSVTSVLVVHPSVPAKNVRELLALAQKSPGRLNYASSGNGTITHLAGELFKLMGKVNITHVPYKGGAPAVVDTIGGQTQAYCAGLAATMPHVRSGKLRALGVTTLKRSASAPDIPTLDEQGLKGFDVNSWGAIFVPAKTPKAVIETLHTAIAAVMNTDAMRETLVKQGMDPLLLGPKELAARIRTESDSWAKVIKNAGIKLE